MIRKKRKMEVSILMLYFRKKDSKEVLKRMAKLHGCPVSKIREEMQLAIEEARNSDEPEKRAEFQRLFGDKTPTPEEFICELSRNLNLKNREGL